MVFVGGFPALLLAATAAAALVTGSAIFEIKS